MKSINNEQILNMIYDFADIAGMRIGDFMERLAEQFGGYKELPDGIPEDVAEEIYAGREAIKRERAAARQAESDAATQEEIKKFREIFPDVETESIPDEVWEDVADGANLAHAYALYLVQNESLANYADGVNRRNSERGITATSDGSTEPIYTKEQVEHMSENDVRKNYKGIVNAMKNWRFN